MSFKGTLMQMLPTKLVNGPKQIDKPLIIVITIYSHCVLLQLDSSHIFNIVAILFTICR